MIVTVSDIKDHLGLEQEHDLVIDRKIERQLLAADAFLKSAIGENYPEEDPRVQELICEITAELYDNRGAMSQKAESRFNSMATQMIRQIRLEMQED